MSDNQVRPTFLPARKVWERYGVSSMTLHRWLQDDEVGFPRPIYIKQCRYWKLSDLEAWESKRAAATQEA